MMTGKKKTYCTPEMETIAALPLCPLMSSNIQSIWIHDAEKGTWTKDDMTIYDSDYIEDYGDPTTWTQEMLDNWAAAFSAKDGTGGWGGIWGD